MADCYLEFYALGITIVICDMTWENLEKKISKIYVIQYCIRSGETSLLKLSQQSW